MDKAVARPTTLSPHGPPRRFRQEGVARAGLKHRTNRVLKIERSCERPRLGSQLLATAYELLTPILRRALPQADRCPGGSNATTEGPPQARAGGNRA